MTYLNLFWKRNKVESFEKSSKYLKKYIYIYIYNFISQLQEPVQPGFSRWRHNQRPQGRADPPRQENVRDHHPYHPQQRKHHLGARLPAATTRHPGVQFREKSRDQKIRFVTSQMIFFCKPCFKHDLCVFRFSCVSSIRIFILSAFKRTIDVRRQILIYFNFYFYLNYLNKRLV